MSRFGENASRRCLKLAFWPSQDRELYLLAISADPFSDPTAAADWRPATRHKNERGYGRWLTFLLGQECDLTAAPTSRVTRERVGRYIGELQAQGVAEYTLRNRLLELHAVIASIASADDWSWIRGRSNTFNRRAAKTYRGKARFLDLRIVVEACERALASAGPNLARDEMPAYRNWLILYFLALIPIRLGNLSSLKIGRQLIFLNGEWLVRLEASETKNAREYSAPVPAKLTIYLERYLAELRPALANETSGDSLWLSINGGPLAAHTIRLAIRELTARNFGTAHGPHSLRHSFTTFTAGNVGIDCARAGMGHDNSRRTQGYNHASTLAASIKHGDLIDRLRSSSSVGKRKRRS